jgi:hypothetical protein
MTLTYNPLSGTSDLGIRNCAPQIGYRGRTLLHIEDKSVEAEEVCEQVMGAELCLSPKKVLDRESGEILWENNECRQADDYDGCWSMLFERYRGMLSESESLQSKVCPLHPLLCSYPCAAKKLIQAHHAARDEQRDGQHVTSGVVASARAGALNIAARRPGRDRYSAANLLRSAE